MSKAGSSESMQGQLPSGVCGIPKEIADARAAKATTTTTTTTTTATTTSAMANTTTVDGTDGGKRKAALKEFAQLPQLPSGVCGIPKEEALKRQEQQKKKQFQ
eukprot:m.148214 g.148214  ORF g.148214 m.148214 type:complete len:103 (+) comp14169_c0_seq1:60-368(+)